MSAQRLGRIPIDELSKEEYSKAVSQMVTPLDGSSPLDPILDITPVVKRSNTRLSQLMISMRSLKLMFHDEAPRSIDAISEMCESENTVLNQDLRTIYKEALTGERDRETGFVDKALGR